MENDLKAIRGVVDAMTQSLETLDEKVTQLAFKPRTRAL